MKQVNCFSSSQHSRLQLQCLKTGTYINSLHDQIIILISNSSFSRFKKKKGISHERGVKFLNHNDCYSITKINRVIINQTIKKRQKILKIHRQGQALKVCASSTLMQQHASNYYGPQQPNTRRRKSNYRGAKRIRTWATKIN